MISERFHRKKHETQGEKYRTKIREPSQRGLVSYASPDRPSEEQKMGCLRICRENPIPLQIRRLLTLKGSSSLRATEKVSDT